ncbi:AraC family transcriptional regulator [Paraburkholderia ferrariae]|uniref:AraC family transcriptional regulator n=1 Tax=Paraburkholderia ferrariae TaxID=386056 RepID=UPI000485880C|nr:AraC family transcriptional regulator [Paraburkholderia ferrariae]
MAQRPFQIVRCHASGVQAVAADTRHTFARHTHDQFGIGVIVRGAQKSASGRGMVEAGPGHTITVNPGEVHDGMPIGDAGRAWRMLYFDPWVVADAMLDVSEGRTHRYEFTRPVMHQPQFAQHFLALYSAMTAAEAGHADTLREALLLTLLAGAAPSDASIETRVPVPAGIARARSRIDDDPTAPLTLAELAQDCGLSRFQLIRAFSRATGLTPHAYLMQRRILGARRLIAQGVPLAQAAAASGFADQSHMTRLFVRNYGISPSLYASACAA